MITFNREKSGNSGVLILGGEFTIERANELKTALIRHLDSVECLRINLKNVSEIDLSCLQLLCSAHLTALGQGKEVIVTGADNEVFDQAWHHAGFHSFCCGITDEKATCFWQGGEN
jgi:anti-anti-sigma regulatory factor